jgi:hypothetical protein
MAQLGALEEIADGEEDDQKDSWAVIDIGQNGYPILPKQPLDASLEATKRVLRLWVNQVYSE